MGLGCFVRCSPAKVSACAGSTLGLLDLQGVEKMGLRHVEMRVGFGGVLAVSLGGLAGGLAGLSVYFQSWQVSAACWPFFTLYPMRFHSAKVWNVSAASMAEKMFSALSSRPRQR